MEVMKDIKDIKWNTDGISEPIVMASAAGWYVGRDCWEAEDPNFIEPYSRESGYFETWEDAHRWLIQLICKSLISKGI